MQTATVSIDIDSLRRMPYDQRKARVEALPIDDRQKGRLYSMAAEKPAKSVIGRAWAWVKRTVSRVVARIVEFVRACATAVRRTAWLDVLYYTGLVIFAGMLVLFFGAALIANPVLGVLALLLLGLGFIVAYRAKSVFSWMAAQSLIDLATQIAVLAIESR